MIYSQVSDDSSRALDQALLDYEVKRKVQNKFTQVWQRFSDRYKTTRCFFCGGTGKGELTTGYLPEMGAIMKCSGCRPEYHRTLRVLARIDKDRHERK